MNKRSIILLPLLFLSVFSNGYEYPKPELKFNCEDTPSSPTKNRVVRGVFFYTYDENFDGKEIEMHEINTDAFNKLISSSEFVRLPAAIKSKFDLVSLFDGRCETSINCERIPQNCPSISPCRSLITPETTTITEPPTTKSTTVKQLSTTTSQSTTTSPWPSNYELQSEVTDIFLDFAPQLTEPHLEEIMTALKNMNTYTQYWTASQVDEISTRNSLIVQSEMLKQNTSGTASVMRFSDEIKQHMVSYTKEINPDMSLEEILGMISIVEEIGTATMRYLTFDQYKGLRGPVVSAFANNTVINGFVSTTKAPIEASTTIKVATTSEAKSSETKPTANLKVQATTTKKIPATPKTTTTKSSEVATSKSPIITTAKLETTTKKQESTTKTYIPPPGSSRKPYTRWVGSYRQYSGYYSFGYTWNPFTGGYSWRSRRYTSGTTTTTERYRQRNLVNKFDPIGNFE